MQRYVEIVGEDGESLSSYSREILDKETGMIEGLLLRSSWLIIKLNPKT